MLTVLPFSTTAQPIWRKAFSITRVSSESSRSCKVVVPWHKAASNNTRLEMLFEPGSVTVPWALCRAGTSRKGVANMKSLSANQQFERIFHAFELGRVQARQWLLAHEAAVGNGPYLVNQQIGV